MNHKIIIGLTGVPLFFSQTLTALAITESDVEAIGKETAAGNIFIWFLCAIAFLKISQKIDSFLSSLGVNAGHTGGSLMAEVMIAAKGISTAKRVAGNSHFGNTFQSKSSSNSASSASFLSGGLAGAVSRQFTQSVMHSATQKSSNSVNRKIYESSVQKGSEWANNVTGAVAQGNIAHSGSMKGSLAAKAFTSYMGHSNMTQTNTSESPVSSYDNIEIGGGRVTGTETSPEHPNGITFGMYHADQYMAPVDNYETIKTADNATWYRQYAVNTVERNPYMTESGKINYQEKIVQRMPPMPKRKDHA